MGKFLTWITSGFALLGGCGSGSPSSEAAAPGVAQFHLERVAEGFAQPTDIQAVPGSKALVVLGKEGTAWVWEPGGTPREWLNIAVKTDSELGLLGLAFHPEFATNGKFYVHYNPKDGKTRSRISEWTTDPTGLNSAKEGNLLLEVDQPYENHNGGQIRFGPDGFLYIGLGDGGAAGDPHGYGQDRGQWLGKLLRIDVQSGRAPPDNPFVGDPSVRPEIWAYGLRNPWKFWILGDGSVLVADVGQDTWEEVDRVHRGDNLGWRIMEGNECFEAETCSKVGLQLPVATYGRNEGVSITGGVVSSIGPYANQFLYADFGTGNFWALPVAGGEPRLLGPTKINPSTFGLGSDGAVYVADFGGGALYRVE